MVSTIVVIRVVAVANSVQGRPDGMRSPYPRLEAVVVTKYQSWVRSAWEPVVLETTLPGCAASTSHVPSTVGRRSDHRPRTAFRTRSPVVAAPGHTPRSRGVPAGARRWP